jgi:argininosuccinate lyase
MRERLKSAPNEVVCKYIFEPSILDDSNRSFYNMINLNLAHVLMLNKQEIIEKSDVETILQALLDLRDKGTEAFEVNPLYEDYYFNIEQYLISQIGLESAGKMHTARSRNDLHSTIDRMNVRDSIIKIYPKVLKLRSILINLASENTETVMTGYTHMQPAQPITLAHYLLGVANAVERDYKRLEEAYTRLNYCPLGSGAFAGTSFNIDRQYTAELLGFYGPIQNSIDAVASRDYLLEFAANFAILGSNINRFVNDLYIWATNEFGYVEVDDSMAACSSIMPQKKNPITLEHIKAKTSHLLSGFVSIFTCMKGIPYGHCRDLGGESIKMYWESCTQVDAILELLNGTLSSLKIKKDKMKLNTNTNFSTVTELADELVKKEKLSFRVAHQIVGKVVSECVEKGINSDGITIEMINNVGKIYALRTFDWTQDDVNKLLNATYSVENKLSLGSPSQKESANSISKLEKGLDKDVQVYENRVKELELSEINLENEMSKIKLSYAEGFNL